MVYPSKALGVEAAPVAPVQSVETGSYKSKPTITVRSGKYYVAFGLNKAQAILENREVISLFVAGQLPKDHVSLSSFKGNQVLTVKSRTGKEFSAGVTKFKWIVENWDTIQNWYNTNK
jgi:hypothetical protein